jgi:hypothetical protein
VTGGGVVGASTVNEHLITDSRVTVSGGIALERRNAAMESFFCIELTIS